MASKFRNRFRIESTRLKNWDYRLDASYFITICTKNKEHFFGEIIDRNMQLSPIGMIAKKYWTDIPMHFPFVQLGEFVIMPNHVHGIIIINNDIDGYNGDKLNVETPKLGVSTIPNKKICGKNDKWKPGTLGVIVNQYKRICTINARKIKTDFKWQPRFYEHIIRNDKSYLKIEDYIYRNPENWKTDRHNN